MAYPFIIQGNNITVVIDNSIHTVSKTHITYQQVLDAIKDEDWELVKNVIEPKKVILDYGYGHVTIGDGEFLWKGEPMHNYLVTKIIDMLQEGLPIDPLVNFMHNLMQNPSARAVKELYGFLEKGVMPITPDGHFLAYKKVRDNYFDMHSGTMDNSVGKIVEMERNAVDDDKDRTCSAGLHFCSLGYLASFGGARIMIVKINPADVVSIPSDYHDTKGRACRYEVVGELEGEIKAFPEKAFTSAVQSYDEEEDLDDEEDAYFVFEDAEEEEDLDDEDEEYYCEADDEDVVVTPCAVWPFLAGSPAVAPVVTDCLKNVLCTGTETAAPDYDRFGKPLSMTKDAIRKRAARAAKAGYTR